MAEGDDVRQARRGKHRGAEFVAQGQQGGLQDGFGQIGVYCPACFCAVYIRGVEHHADHRTLLGLASLAERLVYVNVMQGGQCYRWEAVS